MGPGYWEELQQGAWKVSAVRFENLMWCNDVSRFNWNVTRGQEARGWRSWTFSMIGKRTTFERHAPWVYPSMLKILDVIHLTYIVDFSTFCAWDIISQCGERQTATLAGSWTQPQPLALDFQTCSDRLETKECQEAESLKRINSWTCSNATFAFQWWWRNLGWCRGMWNIHVIQIIQTRTSTTGGMLHDTARYQISDVDVLTQPWVYISFQFFVHAGLLWLSQWWTIQWALHQPPAAWKARTSWLSRKFPLQLLQITLSGQKSQPGTSKSPAHVYLILFQVCDRIATWAEF